MEPPPRPSLAERANRPSALIPDLYLPGTLPWHAFRAIVASWPASMASGWPHVARDYVAAHFRPMEGWPDALAQRRRVEVEEALLAELLSLAGGGWS